MHTSLKKSNQVQALKRLLNLKVDSVAGVNYRCLRGRGTQNKKRTSVQKVMI